MNYNAWLAILRNVLQEQNKPLGLKDGHWNLIDRKALWISLGSRIFDTHLNQIKNCAIEVLAELDPQFEMHVEDRYIASIRGKVLTHSTDLRNGLAETLALLGNYGNRDILPNCTQHKAESVAVLSLRQIFNHADWRLWASLNDLLPVLAEAAPSEFLDQVEHALRQKPCPFDELFSQEGKGLIGRNYLTGLYWALESLAWTEDHLVRVAVILAELACHDPGGNWVNRPANSLTTILLPWYPQTLAPFDKRIASIKAIKTDFPDVAWKVLLSFLPNQHQTSFGAHKPRWHHTLPDDWKPTVTNREYLDQVKTYAEIAVEMARNDLIKLKELVSNLDNLPEPSFDIILEYLASSVVTELPESQRLPIWISLMGFAQKHRKFADAKWALSADLVSRIELTAIKLSPKSPEGLYRRLFNKKDFDLYEEKGNWEAQRKKLDEKRQQATYEIFNAKGLQGVLDFTVSVESPNQVGWALGLFADHDIDLKLLPAYLEVENVKLRQFAARYIWSRYQRQGWAWVDTLNRSGWSLSQNREFLMYLPFEAETWHRASEWLGVSENTYWDKVPVNPYQSSSDPLLAVDKLLEASRPNAAIDCLHYRLIEKMPLDISRTVKALLEAVSVKEPPQSMDSYNITELIKALQNDPQTDVDDLFRVEWAYLPLLNRYNDAEPKLLEERLSTQPEFFCEVIRHIYRSKNEEKKNEEIDENKSAIATNAWRLLKDWKRPPGLQEDGSFVAKDFELWLKSVEAQCRESGHLEVAMIHIGGILFYCPADSQGLWIVREAASALNASDAEDMRRGYQTEVYNSRGVHRVDPTGKPEREISAQWREKADALENAGFARFAATLRDLSRSYQREAERIINEHKSEEKGE